MSPSSPSPSAELRPAGRPLLVVALLAFLANALSLSCGWIWDDDSYITANAIVQSSNGWRTIWEPGATPQYYPLVFLGFWIEHAMIGLEPFWFHLVNVLMHAVNAALLLTALRRLEIRHAFWIAAIFAVHPMGVESVAWVTERKNVQSMMFALASVMMFIRMIDRDEGRWGAWIASFTCFVAALLSKTTAVFVPPCLVMILLWRRRPLDARTLAAIVPFFLVGATLGLLTAHLEKHHVGATGSEFALSVLDRMQLAGRIVAFYVARFVVPTEQIFIYPRFEIDAARAAAWLPSVACAATVAASVWRWRATRAPLLVVLWIGAALFPALGFFDVWPFRYSFVADHFAYAAMPALALVVVIAAGRVAAIVPRIKTVGPVLGGASLACMVALSIAATPKYESEEILWRTTFEQNPKAWIASNNVASILLRKAGASAAAQRNDEAVALAREALVFAQAAGEANPDEFTNAVNRSEAHRLLGDRTESLREIELAARLAPRISDVQWLRARALESVGRTDEARATFEEAARLAAKRGEEVNARRDLMRLAVARRAFDEAARECARLVELEPDNADMQANLGSILVAAARKDEARRALLRAASLGIERFSRREVWIAASVGYMKLAIEAPLASDEAMQARTIATRLALVGAGDPFARYLQLALALRLGDQAALQDLTRLESDARKNGNTQLADEIARFLATQRGDPVPARYTTPVRSSPDTRAVPKAV